MLVEFSWRWPFARRLASQLSTTPSAGGIPAGVHRSWVRTDAGVGWIHHHEPDGYVIELRSGALVKRAVGSFTNIAPE